ncbi:hypothetical protein PINS_up008618 [Pythium insidiosum]|nr:hypothetical protein PINS_up008618 [Pythium insidiosum]
MDFGTIKGRLDEGLYVAVDDFIADVELVFTNARTFNPPNHYIHVDAGVLLARFREMMGGDSDRSASLKAPASALVRCLPRQRVRAL